MDMNVFWGTVAGLIFSLVIYILTNIALESFNKGKYKRYLKDELTFNSNLLESIIGRILSDRTTISSGHEGVFATYFLYLFQTGIMNKTLEKGYYFDFITDTTDRSNILEFTNFIALKMNNIDFNISEYRKNPAIKDAASQSLLFQETELRRIKSNIDKVIKKL